MQFCYDTHTTASSPTVPLGFTLRWPASTTVKQRAISVPAVNLEAEVVFSLRLRGVQGCGSSSTDDAGSPNVTSVSHSREEKAPLSREEERG
jgi:hypothetical protein